jgi:DNA-binding transcriptional regulator PaaX
MSVAMNGRDPRKLWSEKWKGMWNLFMFDLPSAEHQLRKKMLRALRSSGCGCLQGSVWISCRMPGDLKPFLTNEGTRPSSLLVLESKTKGPHTDRWMVEDAWNWDAIERRYVDAVEVLRRLPTVTCQEDLLEWAQLELSAWKAVVDIDPFLPEKLLPDGYSGQWVWNERLETLQAASDRAMQLMS